MNDTTTLDCGVGYTERTYSLKQYPEGWQWRFTDNEEAASPMFTSEQEGIEWAKERGKCTHVTFMPITPSQHLATALSEAAIPERFTVEHNTLLPDELITELRKQPRPIFAKDRLKLKAQIENIRELSIHVYRFNVIDSETNEQRRMDSAPFEEVQAKDMAQHCAQQLLAVMAEKMEGEKRIVPFAMAGCLPDPVTIIHRKKGESE